MYIRTCVYVFRQYRLVLAKVQSGELSVRLKTVLNTVMKARHVFRGGTRIDDKREKERREYYKNLIDERITHRDRTTTTSTRGKTR